ncbi:MAG: ECF transporter S component [Atopobiaceae bacterium]|jgi:riboflavin transporter FmnP|nr:ECF transporter S component [Atopobiaceae bacterium]
MAENSNLNRHDTHSTTAQAGGWTTRRIALSALFCAASMVASFVQIPIFPAAPYLMYDPSGIVCLVASFAFGPATGALVSVLSWVPHLVMDPWGGLMGIVSTLTLVVPAGLVYQRACDRRGAAVGMALGFACSLVACIAGNLVVTPLYTAVSVADVAAMIVPILLPFNALKLAINCGVTAGVYKAVSRVIGR